MNVDVHNELKKSIIKIARIDVDIYSIKESTMLINDLGFDSIKIISLIIELESKFNIIIEDDELDIQNLTIYGNLYRMISKKLGLKTT